jgi:hypothetical protein
MTTSTLSTQDITASSISSVFIRPSTEGRYVIKNPKTQRWVKVSGRKGRQLLDELLKKSHARVQQRMRCKGPQKTTSELMARLTAIERDVSLHTKTLQRHNNELSYVSMITQKINRLLQEVGGLFVDDEDEDEDEYAQ